jgi:hypothetical protein
MKKLREIRVIRGLFLGNEVNKLQFKIKDQDYFLAFVEQEKRWYVFAPTSEGVNRIPVYVDAARYERPGILEQSHNLSS